MKRKRKSWKGIMPIRKSARLIKTSTPFVVKTNFSNDESYHGDSEDNDSSDGETLGNVSKTFENDLPISMYQPNKFNS